MTTPSSTAGTTARPAPGRRRSCWRPPRSSSGRGERTQATAPAVARAPCLPRTTGGLSLPVLLLSPGGSALPAGEHKGEDGDDQGDGAQHEGDVGAPARRAAAARLGFLGRGGRGAARHCRGLDVDVLALTVAVAEGDLVGQGAGLVGAFDLITERFELGGLDRASAPRDRRVGA